MAKQLGFVIDQSICMGCKACQVACKDRSDLEVGRLWRKVTLTEGGEFENDGETLENNIYLYWTTLACNHCAEPICVDVCPVDAMYKREEDGIVLIHRETCIGCGACAEACPYNVPVFEEEDNKMGKCDFCVDLVIQGKEPACVGSCPVGAIKFGEIEELREKYGKIDTIEGMPEPVTKPSLVIVTHKDVKL